MSTFAATLVLAVLAPAAAPAPAPAAAPNPLDQLVKLLGQKKCDDAFELIAKVEAPSPATPAGQKAAKAIAKGAEACRKDDAVVALGFSGLARKLAPEDAEVAFTHAEGLVAARARADAVAALDALVAAQPAKKAPKVWMLRARLAHEDGDFEEAVRLLTPLAAEPGTKKEAEPLLASARSGLEKRKEIAFPPPRPAATEKPLVEPTPATRRHQPGQVVEALPGEISLRGERVFKVKLIKGGSYLFKAAGRCERAPREYVDDEGNTIKVKPLDTRGPVFGLDFRVQFGGQESRALAVDVGAADENRIEFLADADEQVIRVWDASNTDKEVTCTMGHFSIEAR